MGINNFQLYNGLVTRTYREHKKTKLLQIQLYNGLITRTYRKHRKLNIPQKSMTQ
jgi:hypothetical protein